MRAKPAPARAAASHSLPFSETIIAHSRNTKRVGARCVQGCKTKLLNLQNFKLRIINYTIYLKILCLEMNVMLNR